MECVCVYSRLRFDFHFAPIKRKRNYHYSMTQYFSAFHLMCVLHNRLLYFFFFFFISLLSIALHIFKLKKINTWFKCMTTTHYLSFNFNINRSMYCVLCNDFFFGVFVCTALKFHWRRCFITTMTITAAAAATIIAVTTESKIPEIVCQ